MSAIDTTELALAPPMMSLVEQGILTPTAFHVGAIIKLTEASNDDDLSQAPEFLQWCAIGSWLGTISTAVKWWIGDWLAFGEGAWGERYAQAAEATGLDIGTLQNWAYTCRQVMPSRRREELSFTSHYAVAKLDPPEQEEWLSFAVKQNESATPGARFGSKDLRRAIKDSGGKVPGELRTTEGQPDDELRGGRHEPYVDLQAVVRAASAVWKAGQPDGNGGVIVPKDTFARLATALGKGDR